MSLAIFDLDNTLIGGDSDYAWGAFLVEQGIVDGDEYRENNDRFYEDYKTGRLDILEYLSFALKPLSEHPMERLLEWRNQFYEHKVKPMLLPKASSLINKHRSQGDTLLIITATNRFVTEPIASALGIGNLIATEPELVSNRFTGRVAGTPSFQDGKIARLEDWLRERDENTEGAWFYSDSHNDLPLLERVDNPVGVDPDERLRRECEQRGWPIMSLRD